MFHSQWRSKTSEHSLQNNGWCSLKNVSACFLSFRSTFLIFHCFIKQVQVHNKGASLRTSLYSEVIHCLNDDYESVKLAALKLIFAISQSHPEE